MIVELHGYQIGEPIYQGTRTIVYRGIRQSDSLKVIIKFLRNPYPSFTELVQFRNQYAIMLGIADANAKKTDIQGVVQPLSLERSGNGYGLVMEDLGAISLEKYLQKNKYLPIETCLQIAIQLANILHNLDRQRVIHKDIKPANILMEEETGNIKLIDFSIASLLPREAQDLKSFNVLEGTLAYISPEQTGRMNRGIDYRSDFYSLGVTLYQLLTGELPFVSSDPMELVHCHISQQPVPPAARNPVLEIPPVVSNIVMKLMAKNAEDRYQSALGLHHDLERCLRSREESGAIANFELGEQDICDRFNIPEKLYGREQEVQTLLNTFERVAGGQSEMLLVAGFSGIGKTAVINEVHKPIVRQKGYFIKGKFDQFNRNIPFSAFVQAFRDLMVQLLGESDAELANWKTKILKAVGENGQVLIEVIPELEQAIGPQPSVPELSGSAAQNRFNLLFEKFIAVFATEEHPLTLFLDDLQWADSASLNLIEVLMGSSQTGYLLLLGAYRDNEVFPSHPLTIALANLEKQNTPISTITLAPLSVEHINRLVAETLSCSTQLALPLTHLIDRKTKGNPFFTTQFLKGLHEDSLLTFDRNLGYWQCDLIQIQDAALTDDVVEFMAGRLHKLPQKTQDVLKLASCIGNQFELETLAIICQTSLEEVATRLWSALREGLLLPQSEAYKFFQGWENEQAQEVYVTVGYRFLHDRVQQAAYASIPGEDKQSTHLKIGRLLLKNIPETERTRYLFDIANHFNLSKALLVESKERNGVIHLNLSAGIKAKLSTAYAAASDYLMTGIELLGDSGWQTQYDLSLNLHTELTEVAYLSGQFDLMTSIAQTTLDRAQTFIDKIKIYETQIQAYIARGQLDLALQTAGSTLKSLKVQIPQQPNQIQTLFGLARTKVNLLGKKIADLVNLPMMQEENDLAAMRILSSALSAAYIGAPKLLPLLVFQQVNLSVRKGNTAFSAFAYSWYGTILCGVLSDMEAGYQFGQLAIEIQEKLRARELRCKALFMMNTFMRHWNEPTRSTIAPLKAAYQAGLETGDLEYASWSAHTLTMHSYMSGFNLSELASELSTYAESVARFQQSTALVYINTYRQMVANLQGNSVEPDCLSGQYYSEDINLPKQIAAGDRTGLAFSYILQLELSYRLGNFARAEVKANLAREYAEACLGMLTTAFLVFFDSLTQLARYATAPSSARKTMLKRVAKNQKQMKTWAKFAPENHQHHYDLVEAERYRLLEKPWQAMEYYDRAIAGAKANQYIQDEALANELFAQFYLDWGRGKEATVYMQEAYYGYARWGAKAKIDHLEQLYPTLLTSILQRDREATYREASSSTSAISLSTVTSHSQTQTATVANISSILDFSSLLKASQSLSGEIELDRLLSALMKIILENAGATKGALLLTSETGLTVDAIATRTEAEKKFKLDRLNRSISLEDYPHLPAGLINTVRRTAETTILDAKTAQDQFAADRYLLRFSPHSLLCMPLLERGNLIGILYLENNLTADAFTRDRIDLLDALCAQAAISLANARLYQQAKQALTDLKQAQLQLVQSEKMSALGNLVAGVAHEINNPVGFIAGNLEPAQNYVEDLFGLIDLYQQEYPEPTEVIEEEIETIDLEFLRSDLPKLIASMHEGTDRIRHISTSLRTFSRTDQEYKVPFNLHEGIDSTLLILKHRLKANENRPAIEIIRNYGNLPEVQCFPGQLNQVFMNLIANSIDALEESNVGCSFDEIGNRITISTSATNGRVIIHITDNGMGMPKEVQERIFEQGFTTKGVGKGTGLGMAIAHQIIVEKHHGTIEINSEFGQGTEFVISL